MVELSSEALQIINLLVAFIIPLLVALVTKRFAEGWVKSLALIVLAACLALLVEWRDTGSFVVFDATILFVQNVLVAVTAHVGILKPAGLSGSDGKVAQRVPAGVGPGSTVRRR